MRHAFKQHVPDEIRGHIQVLSLQTLPRPTINSTALTILFRFDYFLSEILCPDDVLAPTRLAQATLYEHWKGYAPPGSSTLVPLDGSVCENNAHGCAFIALCPTMRIPDDIVWNREIVYNCVWSLLNTLEQHNRGVELSGDGTSIRRILMTGLATGVGNVSP